ncbi:MAG: GAF domain-containing sensor histidine kinase [Nitrospinota bacterium]|nr:GAF domain-containing sensor histidine kinase [Nitrospinota bacterium]
MRERIEKVNFLGKFLASSRSLDETLEMAMIISQDVLGYDHAIIRLLDQTQELRAVKWIGFPREAADRTIRLGEGITGQAAEQRKSILVNDTTNDPRYIKGVENCLSELCSPMIFDGNIIGVFNVESETPAFFSDDDRHILENFVTQLASALEATRLRDELGRAEKLSMIGSFASAILHDIRNDIHQLNIGADLLEMAPDDPARVVTIAQKVRKSAENIHDLVGDIFEFVRTGQTSVTRQKVELAPFMESFTTRLMASSRKDILVNLNVAGSPSVEADPRRLKRLLLNLANNGAEAMPEGGELTISAGKEGGAVFMEVRDSGKGIAPDRLNKIWEPFYTHGKREGTGLGMVIIKKIVDDHGWKIMVASEEEKGTCFRITIPQE